jgi:hypothetical protein
MPDIGLGREIGEVVESNSVSVVVQSANVGSGNGDADSVELGLWVWISQSPSSNTPALKHEADEEVDPFIRMSQTALLRPSCAFGIVSFSATLSADPTRRATALGIGSEEEIRMAQPQVFELLRTEYSVLLTSFSDNAGRLVHRLPPTPPRMHAFVFPCDANTVIALTEDLSFVRSILQDSNQLGVSPDLLVAASIRFAWERRNFDETFFIKAGKALLRVLHSDFDRFESIIARVR